MVSSMMSHQGNVNDVSARKKQPRGKFQNILFNLFVLLIYLYNYLFTLGEVRYLVLLIDV